MLQMLLQGLSMMLSQFRYDLLPADGLEELVKVYTAGAKSMLTVTGKRVRSWSPYSWLSLRGIHGSSGEVRHTTQKQDATIWQWLVGMP